MASRPRGSVNDRPPKWKLFLRRQRWTLRPLAWGCAGMVALAAGTILLRNAPPGGSIASVREWIGTITANAGMRVNDIVIEGRANTPEPFLRAALGVRIGDPIIGFSLERARADIEKLTWVAHATVERRLPGTIVVVLWERRPFAVWQNQGKYVLIDRDGQPVTDEEVAKFRHLPLIVGPGAPDGARVLLDALTGRPAIQSRVVAAMRISERRWNLRMKNGTDILLPEGHEIEALDRLLTLQQETALLDRPLQSIDMRLGDKLVLRPRPAPTDKPPPPPSPNKPV
ncbi:MAG: FtsQ-type POTRA domain-containing protein [Acetobacteraceae bacterium]|nr:FtsQ-type POTRA domain-containing protein [Acetobacteraceae bacterium]